MLFLHGIKLINPHWRWLTYVRKKKKKGASFGVQLPRDGMKILQWSSNPKLPSKNIPLPPRRDPDLFACRAEAGRGWAAPSRGQAGDRRGQADGRTRSGATYRPGETTDMRRRTVPPWTGRKRNRFALLLSAREYFQMGQNGLQDLIVT